MATRTFTSAGVNNLWSNAANWLVAAPVDTDAFNIPNGQTCEFDADLSLWAGLAASTIAAGGKLQASETAGAYVLKTTGDLTVAGTLQAGTSVAVPYPSTCRFTINFSNTAKSINRTATGSIKLYCTQPTNTYITITEALSVGEGTAADPISVNTDVTVDQPWTIPGATVRIVSATPFDKETLTIDVLAATTVTTTAGVDSIMPANSIMILITRNVRIINSGYVAIVYPIGNHGSGDYMACEFNTCYRGVYYGTSFTYMGTMDLLDSARCFHEPTSATFGGVLGSSLGTPQALNTASSCTILPTCVVAGSLQACISGYANTFSGIAFGCSQAFFAESDLILTSTCRIKYSTVGIQQCYSVRSYASFTGNITDIISGTDMLIANTTLGGVTAINKLISGRLYNVLISGTEFTNYTSSQRNVTAYVESFDHNQIANAFKAWCRGGIVTSDTTGCPLVQNGITYDRWYEHACEDTAPEYPCFRQYETTVQPGQTIEVVGWIRIADGEDFGDAGDIPPRLQIIDKFADPLVDSTQTALDEDIIAVYDGTNTGRQDVSVIWANQGDAPRQVIVRMLCYSDQVANTDIDEAWAVATYQDQINTILNIIRPVNTDVAAANTALSFTLTGGKASADAYNDMTLLVQDADDDHWELRSISDWTAGRVITVSSAFSFTPAVGDLAYILGTSYGAPVDLTAITDKLPTNYIMGSSVTTDKDDEIDATLNKIKRLGPTAE